MKLRKEYNNLFLILYLFFFFSCSTNNKYYEDFEVPFYDYLRKNYQSYADYKRENYDYYGARRFYSKVTEIDKGKVVLPENIAGTSNIYNFFSKDVTYEQFYDYRDRMYLMLNNNRGKMEYPQELADMQFFYDCWSLEESAYTKFSQPVRCKINFVETLEFLELRLLKYEKEEKEILKPKPPKPKKRKYVFYFDFDSSAINYESSLKIIQLLKDLDEIDEPYKLKLVGFADRWGTRGYNVKLSRRRVETVKHYLVKNGIPERRIETVDWHGEIDPQVITYNDFKEELNRRVTVYVVTESGEDFQVNQ